MYYCFFVGDIVFYLMGNAIAIYFEVDIWMVEYGRGFISLTFIFVFVDIFFSIIDFVILFYILRVYVKVLFMEMNVFIDDWRDYVKYNI